MIAGLISCWQCGKQSTAKLPPWCNDKATTSLNRPNNSVVCSWIKVEAFFWLQQTGASPINAKDCPWLTDWVSEWVTPLAGLGVRVSLLAVALSKWIGLMVIMYHTSKYIVAAKSSQNAHKRLSKFSSKCFKSIVGNSTQIEFEIIQFKFHTSFNSNAVPEKSSQVTH